MGRYLLFGSIHKTSLTQLNQYSQREQLIDTLPFLNNIFLYLWGYVYFSILMEKIIFKMMDQSLVLVE